MTETNKKKMDVCKNECTKFGEKNALKYKRKGSFKLKKKVESKKEKGGILRMGRIGKLWKKKNRLKGE